MSKELTMGSLFSGSGGFELVATMCGIKPIWASEIEPFPIRVTRARFPDMKHYGDISSINGADLPEVDLISGGSPCQSLSIAGKRAGMSKYCPKCGYKVVGNDEATKCPICAVELEYTRSGLFMEQIRIVKEMREASERRLRSRGSTFNIRCIRPRFMLWENVCGAFTSNKGEDFRAVIEEIIRISEPGISIPRPEGGRWKNQGAVMGDGYSLAWRVLDAQYWGVPQRRKRIALVADFGGESAPEILFKSEGLSGDFKTGGEEGQDSTANTEKGVGMASGTLPPPICSRLWENSRQNTDER